MSTSQDYTAYDEVDDPTSLTVAAAMLTVGAVDDDEELYLTEDFTAGYFSGDFEHTFNFQCTATDGSEVVYLWAIANSVDEIGAKITADDDLLCLSWENGSLVLTERNGDTSTTDTSASALSEDTNYYIRVVRDESLGTYGTLYAYIYTDAFYMNLNDTLVVTLTEKQDFRYLFAVSGKGDGGGSVAWSGTISNLALDEYPYTMDNLRTRVRDLLNESTATFFSDAEINRWLNDGERDIAIKSLCLEQIDQLSTTGSTRTVSYSAYKVKHLEYVPTSGTPKGLVKIKPAHMGRLSGDNVPFYWFESKNNVAIEPVPDGTYTLNAYVGDYPGSEMSLGPDIPEIPPDFRPLIVLYAFMRGLEKEVKVMQANQINGMYLSELSHGSRDKIIIRPGSREDTRIG